MLFWVYKTTSQSEERGGGFDGCVHRCHGNIPMCRRDSERRMVCLCSRSLIQVQYCCVVPSDRPCGAVLLLLYLLGIWNKSRYSSLSSLRLLR